MDVDQLIQIINSTGFPIVMCGALFWLIDKMRTESKENTQAITDVRVTLSELTTFIKTLIELLEDGEEGDADA